MNIFMPHAVDFYKVNHIFMYPKGSTKIYSNFTCRSDRWSTHLPDFDHKVVNFGLLATCQWMLIEDWNRSFFHKPLEEVLRKYKRRMDTSLGKDTVPVDHIEALHKLGFLPILIKALPEGARVNIRVPMYTITNTIDEFYWVTNYLETQLSAESWGPMTSATTAFEFYRLCRRFAKETGITEQEIKDQIRFQGHDFSMRGMMGIHAATSSGAGHLTSFFGTDTVSAIDYLDDFYECTNEAVIGASVPATEHSVMCMGGELGELALFEELIFEKYPKGIISIVSDTWDFWKVITEYMPALKDRIMAREGRVVIRPDSGDPVMILTGTVQVVDLGGATSIEEAKMDALQELVDTLRSETAHGEPGDSEVTGYFSYDHVVYKAVAEIEWNRHDKQYYYIDGEKLASFEPAELTSVEKGAIECLWDTFGGTTTVGGYRTLDTHVGMIYGDSISLPRAKVIFERLQDKNFSSSPNNVVFGIGSFTYQHVTRDSFGTAIKATYGAVNHIGRELSKDPKTDSGVKKSAKGLLRVEYENGNYVLYDQQTPIEELQGELKPIFKDGQMLMRESLTTIRERLTNSYYEG